MDHVSAWTTNGTARPAVYTWVALDRRGQPMQGEMAAASAALVRAELRRLGMQPQSVRERPRPLFGGRRPGSREVAAFSRQLATLNAAGMPIVQAIAAIAGGQRNPRFRHLLGQLRRQVESGAALHEAMGSHPRTFDALYRNLVHAGEAAGALDAVLDAVAAYKERMESLKAKLTKAMVYPAMVLAVAGLVGLVLLLFVVPVFEQTFRDTGAALPLPTRVVIAASRLLQHGWLPGLLASAGALAILGWARRRSFRLARALDRLALGLPVLGRILRQAAMARFARTLGVSFRAGVPLVDALDTVADATGSLLYGAAVRRLREDVLAGHSLQLALRQSGLFAELMVQMAAIGEEAGALDRMLLKAAEFYEEQVGHAVDTLATLLEPLIMLVLGGMVGGMVIALYMPVFKLAGMV